MTAFSYAVAYFGRGAGVHGFVQLGQFAPDADAALLPEGVDQFIEKFRDSVAGLIYDDGVFEVTFAVEEAFAGGTFRGEEADVEEAIAGQPREC